MELPAVTSARAAEIVGVGYEGFRSYLKRGLLGRVGMLPSFHAPGSATTDDPAPRSGWKTFSMADLCLMRIAKMLMDSGFSFVSANAVVSLPHRPIDDRRADQLFEVSSDGRLGADFIRRGPPFGPLLSALRCGREEPCWRTDAVEQATPARAGRRQHVP